MVPISLDAHCMFLRPPQLDQKGHCSFLACSSPRDHVRKRTCIFCEVKERAQNQVLHARGTLLQQIKEDGDTSTL